MPKPAHRRRGTSSQLHATRRFSSSLRAVPGPPTQCAAPHATCSTQPGYTPYDDCAKRAADNARKPIDDSNGVFNPVSASGTITAERMGCRTYREWQCTRLLPIFPRLSVSH